MTYKIIMEDATRYLPHDPTGRDYQHFVYGPKGLAFSGTRPECEAWIANIKRAACNKARRERDQVMRDSGLVKIRGNLGGTYWE